MRPTARCTSSTCIAGSSSTACRSRCTCAIRSSRASWTSRPASAASTASCTTRRGATRSGRSRHALAGAAGRGALASERLAARHRAAAARRARRASRSCRRWSKLAEGAAGSGGRACTRCGRSTGSMRSSLRPSSKALEDPSRDVRVSAIRIAERWLGEANHPIQAAVLKRLDDPDWAVRQQLAASLGALPAGARETAAVALLERYGRRPGRHGRSAERAARQRSGGPRAADGGEGCARATAPGRQEDARRNDFPRANSRNAHGEQ